MDTPFYHEHRLIINENKQKFMNLSKFMPQNIKDELKDVIDNLDDEIYTFVLSLTDNYELNNIDSYAYNFYMILVFYQDTQNRNFPICDKIRDHIKKNGIE